METNDERIKNKLLKIQEIQEIRNDKYFAWLRYIITLAIGFFGIIISLKSDKPQNFIQHVFFIIALASLASGIFTGIMVLYSEIHVLTKVRKKHYENILKMLDDKKLEKIEQINRDSIYDILEYVCFTSFIISLISLVLYSYFTY